MIYRKFLAFTVSALFSVFLSNACFAQAEDEDPAGHALRELMDAPLQGCGMVLPDGLTFAQREFLYGFTVDPSLLQGAFIYTNFIVAEVFATSVNPAEYSARWHRLFGQISVGQDNWFTIDEFHRCLAMNAEHLSDPDVMTTGRYTFHASRNAAGDRLILLLTPIPN